jgi:hypothetical protein
MIILPASPLLPDHGRIGWHNLVTSGNVTTTSNEAGFPAINLANPTTFQLWRAAAAGAVNITVMFGEATEVDYVGIARHNFGSAGIGYQLQGTVNGSAWSNIDAAQAPADNGIIVHEFTAQALLGLRIQLGAGSAAAQAAVLHVGSITRLQRRIYVGHTPLNLGRQTAVSTGMSESGQFLGRVVTRREYVTQNLDPDWYRETLDPFAEASAAGTFFWAWRPSSYPNEVGYAWATDNPQPSNDRANGMMGFALAVQGIIE